MQRYFIIPIAVFVSISSILVLVLPIAQEPIPALIAVGTTLLGLPAYVFFVMETPWKLKPTVFSRISSKPSKTTIIIMKRPISNVFRVIFETFVISFSKTSKSHH